ncbi:putative Pleckstrin-like proteiny domain-containing family G member 6 [Hypsibius exemplaris]|uniref:Pleckstrin-like proteiny domain-containing family G member 6 n=1 Tax=Hypsibius exemplaris TaxID=2072580 RepID=A0A1W0X0P8_HYPEX|nr:putative Pleckstrin-like proteiny domain-containing family G member 6 [Hypsibius exemplaris]
MRLTNPGDHVSKVRGRGPITLEDSPPRPENPENMALVVGSSQSHFYTAPGSVLTDLDGDTVSVCSSNSIVSQTSTVDAPLLSVPQRPRSTSSIAATANSNSPSRRKSDPFLTLAWLSAQRQGKELQSVFNSWQKTAIPWHKDVLFEPLPKCELIESSDEGWRAIVKTEGLSKKQCDQQEAVWELLEKELSYIRKLETLCSFHMAAFDDLQARNFPWFQYDKDRVFGNIEELLLTNRTFWNNCFAPLLQNPTGAALDVTSSSLYNGFINVEDHLKAYLVYCPQYHNLAAYYKAEKSGNEYFQSLMEWFSTQPVSERHALTAWLFKPVQHVQRYHILLGAILTKTNDQQQKTLLQNMINSMEKFVHKINEQVKETEEHEALQNIYERIAGYDIFDGSATEEVKALLKPYTSTAGHLHDNRKFIKNLHSPSPCPDYDYADYDETSTDGPDNIEPQCSHPTLQVTESDTISEGEGYTIPLHPPLMRSRSQSHDDLQAKQAETGRLHPSMSFPPNSSPNVRSNSFNEFSFAAHGKESGPEQKTDVVNDMNDIQDLPLDDEDCNDDDNLLERIDSPDMMREVSVFETTDEPDNEVAFADTMAEPLVCVGKFHPPTPPQTRSKRFLSHTNSNILNRKNAFRNIRNNIHRLKRHFTDTVGSADIHSSTIASKPSYRQRSGSFSEDDACKPAANSKGSSKSGSTTSIADDENQEESDVVDQLDHCQHPGSPYDSGAGSDGRQHKMEESTENILYLNHTETAIETTETETDYANIQEVFVTEVFFQFGEPVAMGSEPVAMGRPERANRSSTSDTEDPTEVLLFDSDDLEETYI